MLLKIELKKLLGSFFLLDSPDPSSCDAVPLMAYRNASSPRRQEIPFLMRAPFII